MVTTSKTDISLLCLYSLLHFRDIINFPVFQKFCTRPVKVKGTFVVSTKERWLLELFWKKILYATIIAYTLGFCNNKKRLTKVNLFCIYKI